MSAPLPRRPLLPATFRGVSAAWLWRRVQDEADTAPAALARIAGTEAGKQLAYALAELREAARQWEEWARAERADTASGTAVQADSPSGARLPHEVTTAQAAELLGVTEGMVRRYCRTGKLAARRVGTSWLINRESIGDLRDTRRAGAA